MKKTTTLSAFLLVFTNVSKLIFLLVLFTFFAPLGIGAVFSIFWNEYHEYRELVGYILFLIAGAFFLEYLIHRLLKGISSSGLYYFIGATYFTFVLAFMTLLSSLCFYGCPNDTTALTKSVDLLVVLPFLYIGIRMIFLKKSK